MSRILFKAKHLFASNYLQKKSHGGLSANEKEGDFPALVQGGVTEKCGYKARRKTDPDLFR